MKRIAINGFGRIGRAAFKILLTRDDVEVVGINDLTDIPTLAHLLRYDSVHHGFDSKVTTNEKHLIVDGTEYPVFAQRDPKDLPWQDLQVDVVLECTGFFRTQELAMAHVTAGAKRVLISAPAKGDDVETLVKGVMENCSDDKNIFSNASCTTNCIAPVVQVLDQEFGIEKAMMTTIHAYTADQRLVDGPHSDLRRARAAAQNIIPTTTGAAKATTKVVPSLQGKFDGLAIRVPVASGSLSDITCIVSKNVSIDDVNNAFLAAAKGRMQGILVTTDDPIVSSDIIGNPASSIVDLSLTNVVDGNMVKVVSWYDNEWGYANRLVDMAVMSLS